MYKLLLCWRYLLTRYLAMACVVSVMLGVATLIVVNSVMSGFSTKLKERLHGLLSDVLVESTSLDGFPDPDDKMRRIRESEIGQYVEAMTPTVEVFAILQFRVRGDTVTRTVRVVGVDPRGRAAVGGFGEYLVKQDGSPTPASFDLGPDAQWRYNLNHPPLPRVQSLPRTPRPGEPPDPDPPPSRPKLPHGIIVGKAIASFRDKANSHPGQNHQDIYMLNPGDDVFITTVSGAKLMPVNDRFAVSGYFKSEMSEYDASYVFVPLDYLQHIRAMDNRATSIQIKLKDYGHAREVQKTLRLLFPEPAYAVNTWEDKQGPLLAAISIERGLLNLLLFLIIGVAGFGILAIFSMIVVEKTRDIGILKALGASNGGVLSIFLSYGLLLGMVGAGLGTVLGLAITININEIEVGLTRLTGQEIFDRTVYYFDKIPTNIQPMSIALVVFGALAIAVLSSVVPSLRAALLHPVRALRYE